jgi:hypothetical protein
VGFDRSGYDPIATCAPQNFDMVKSYGASAVFDYTSEDVARDIKSIQAGGCAMPSTMFPTKPRQHAVTLAWDTLAAVTPVWRLSLRSGKDEKP